MMKIVFLDASTLGSTSLAPIAELGELVCYPVSSPSEALERVKDADIIITNKVKITAEVLDAAPKLRLVCEAATGVNNIDLEAARQRNIPVKNVSGYSTDSVVQLTFALILELVCKTSGNSAWIKDGFYSKHPIFTRLDSPFMDLSGRTIGIVGMGTIGSKVAKVAEAFGMKVVYFSTSGTSHCKEYPSLSLEELLSAADIVSIHAPLNEKTINLIDAPQLALMKKNAIIINIGRGGIVNEKALADTISACGIAGAGLDVFTCEPLPQDHPLLHTTHPERLCMTPHIGWASEDSLQRLVAGVAENIKSIQ